jgi:pimeloyl-ACP methyl ester carboxylesterase
MTTVQQVFNHRWRVPARAFQVHADDGVRIEGTRLGPMEVDRPAIALAHGLMGWHARPRFAAFAEHLTRWFTVYAFDLRGHGSSGGVCDYGGAEIRDVDAVVARARSAGHPSVSTVGTSMGGIAVLRHGGQLGGVDTVVGISSLAYWDWHDGADPKARRNMRARIGSRQGRAAMRVWGVRLPDEWKQPESPEDVIGKIAPTPVVIVHGTNDRLFPIDHAWRLYDAAGEPKRLLVGDGFGHAEDGLSAAFASRLGRVLHETLELPWSG